MASTDQRAQPAAPPPAAYPPPGGYQAPAAEGTVQIGEAFNYGWKKFQENLGPIILGVLAYAAISAVIYGIAFAIMAAGASTGNEEAAVAALGTGMFFAEARLLSSPFAFVWSSTMRCANCFTSALAARAVASLPSSTSAVPSRATCETNSGAIVGIFAVPAS